MKQADGVNHSCVVSGLLQAIPEGIDSQKRAEDEAIVRSVGAMAYFGTLLYGVDINTN